MTSLVPWLGTVLLALLMAASNQVDAETELIYGNSKQSNTTNHRYGKQTVQATGNSTMAFVQITKRESATVVVTDLETGVNGTETETEFVYLTDKTSALEFKWLAVDAKGQFNSTEVQYGTHELAFKSKEKCQTVQFSVAMQQTPTVILGVHTSRATTEALKIIRDESYVWVEAASPSNLTFCVHERMLFSGAHDIKVNYLALANDTKAYGSVTEHHVWAMDDARKEDKAMYCKTFKYSHRFIESPRVFVTMETNQPHSYQMNAFTECEDGEYVKICVQTNDESQVPFNPSLVKMHVLVNGGDLHNCSGITDIPSNLACYASSEEVKDPVGVNNAAGYKFGCIKTCNRCLHSDKQICSSDMGLYEGECQMKRETCHMYGTTIVQDVTVADASVCKDRLNYQAGRVPLTVGAGGQYYSAEVALNMSEFHSYSDVLVASTLFWNHTDATASHVAGVTWTSNITRKGFEVFASYPGFQVVPHAYWIAYQVNVHTRTEGTLKGGVKDLGKFDGNKCVEMKDSYITSMSHQGDKARGSLATWTSTVNGTTKTCVHETSRFQGAHTNWKLNWLEVGEDKSEDLIERAVGAAEEQPDTGVICKSVTLRTVPSDLRAWTTVSVPSNDRFQTGSSAYVGWIESVTGKRIKLCFDYTNPDEGLSSLSDAKFSLMLTNNQQFSLRQL